MGTIFMSFQKAIGDVLSTTNYSANKEEFVFKTFSIACTNAILDIFDIIPESKFENLNKTAEKEPPQELIRKLSLYLNEEQYCEVIKNNFKKTLLSFINALYKNASDLEKIKLNLIIEEFASGVK